MVVFPIFFFAPYKALAEKADAFPHIYAYHLLVVLILLFGLFVHTPPRPWQLSIMLKNKLFAALGLLWLVSAVYGLGSASESQLKHFITFSYGFFLFFLYGLIIFDKRFIDDFCLGFLYSGCLFLFIMVFVLGITPDDVTKARSLLTSLNWWTEDLLGVRNIPWQLKAEIVKRVAAMNPNSHGFYAALLAMVSFTQLARTSRFLMQVVFLLLFAMGIYWLALAASRGSALALVVSMTCYAALSGKSLLIKIKRMSVFAVAIGVCLATVVVGNAQIIVSRLQALFNPAYLVNMSRFRWYEQLVQLFPEYFLVGAGVGQWADKVGFDYNSIHPHSIVIQLLLELGIAGALPLILLYVGGALAFLRVIRDDGLPATAHSLAMGWFLCFLFLHFDGSVWGRTIPFLPFSAALIAISSRYAERGLSREMLPAKGAP